MSITYEPLWIMRNLEQSFRTRLRQYSDIPVLAVVPDRWTPAKGPVITVNGDGAGRGHGWDRQVIRVTVHAQDLPTVWKLLRAVDALVSSWRFKFSLLASIEPAGMVPPVRDSKLGGAVGSTSFTLVANRKKVVNEK